MVLRPSTTRSVRASDRELRVVIGIMSDLARE